LLKLIFVFKFKTGMTSKADPSIAVWLTA